MKFGTNSLAMRIVERRPDGSGVIEVPLAVATRGIISANTAGGGSGSFDLDVTAFEQMVRNFPGLPGPVAVYFGHIPQKDRRLEPAAGFVEKVWVEGSHLWGRIDLGPRAFRNVVDERGFRSFSVEADFNAEVTTGSVLEGWSLSGGAITNTPALDVQFKVAASAPEAGSARRVAMSTAFTWPDGKETDEMTLEQLTAKVTQLEGAVKERDEKIAQLTRDLEAEKTKGKPPKDDDQSTQLTREVAASKTKVAELEAAQKQDRETILKLNRQIDERDLRELVVEGLKAGKLIPAQVEGWDKNPSEWLSKSPFRDVQSLRTFLSTAPVVVKLSNATPGSGQEIPADGPEARFNAAVTKVQQEKSLSYGGAVDVVKATDPKLWAEFAATQK